VRDSGAGKPKTNPNEAKLVKASHMSEMHEEISKQSQTGLSNPFSVAYRPFGAFFREEWMPPPMIQDGRKTKPNKAKLVKASSISEIHHNLRKQSQTGYHARFQCLTGVSGPFFGENGCFPSIKWPILILAQTRNR
jgi:hypothetical protein